MNRIAVFLKICVARQAYIETLLRNLFNRREPSFCLTLLVQLWRKWDVYHRAALRCSMLRDCSYVLGNHAFLWLHTFLKSLTIPIRLPTTLGALILLGQRRRGVMSGLKCILLPLSSKWELFILRPNTRRSSIWRVVAELEDLALDLVELFDLLWENFRW